MKIGAAKNLDFEKTLSDSSSFDFLYDMVALLDENEKVLYANRAFLSFVQIKKNQLKNLSNLSECIKFDFGDEENVFSRCKKQKKYIGAREIAGKLNDESEISVQIGVQPLVTDEEVKGYLVSIQDKSLELNLHLKYKDVIDQLEEGFDESISSFINIVEMMESNTNFHNQKVTSLSVKIAEQLKMTEKEIRVIESAARLHDIGKIGMSPGAFAKDLEDMNSIEKKEYMKHPVLGELIFKGIPIFKDICSLIRTHHEYYDGSGFPDGLSKDEVPLGGYIIGLADEYVKLNEREDSVSKNSLKIQKYNELRYHPMVVDAFLEVVQDKAENTQRMVRKRINIEELKIGMILAQKLNTNKGLLLMLEEEKVSQNILDKIHSYHENDLIDETVEIYTPMSSEEIAAEKQAKIDSQNSNDDVKVLVVDDMPDLNMIFCESVNSEDGFTAKGVFNGQEALDELDKQSYDIVMIDMMMPIMDGATTVKHIRERGLTMPIVMCTAVSDHKIVIQAFQNGADDYLVKPVVKDDIFECFENTLVKRVDMGDDFKEVKALRNRQMLVVLEQIAPNVIAEMRQKNTKKKLPAKLTKNIKNHETGEYEVVEFAGEVLSINKQGFELKTKQCIDDNRGFGFIITSQSWNKALKGMAKLVEEMKPSETLEEGFYYYKVQFVIIEK